MCDTCAKLGSTVSCTTEMVYDSVEQHRVCARQCQHNAWLCMTVSWATSMCMTLSCRMGLRHDSVMPHLVLYDSVMPHLGLYDSVMPLLCLCHSVGGAPALALWRLTPLSPQGRPNPKTQTQHSGNPALTTRRFLLQINTVVLTCCIPENMQNYTL